MDLIATIGKYIVITTCLIAVAQGIIEQKWFAHDIRIAYACLIGAFIWLIGFIGVKVRKYRAKRAEKDLPTTSADS